MSIAFERYENVSDNIYRKYSFQFPFERNYDKSYGRLWMQNNWHTIFYYVATYLAVIYYGQLYMKSRPRKELRWPLFWWNISLAIFSILGTFRTFPELFFTLSVHGFHHSVCVATFLDCNVTAFWVFVFVLSKVVELGDTFFIILRKRKLTLLHVFHHVSVPISCFYVFKEQVAFGRWMIYNNFLIHSVMYTYYALKVAGVHVPRQVSMLITKSQVVQMVAGCVVMGYAMQSFIRGQNCYVSKGMGVYVFVLYCIYFYMFVRFYYTVYKGGATKKRL